MGSCSGKSKLSSKLGMNYELTSLDGPHDERSIDYYWYCIYGQRNNSAGMWYIGVSLADHHLSRVVLFLHAPSYVDVPSGIST